MNIRIFPLQCGARNRLRPGCRIQWTPTRQPRSSASSHLQYVNLLRTRPARIAARILSPPPTMLCSPPPRCPATQMSSWGEFVGYVVAFAALAVLLLSSASVVLLAYLHEKNLEREAQLASQRNAAADTRHSTRRRATQRPGEDSVPHGALAGHDSSSPSPSPSPAPRAATPEGPLGTAEEESSVDHGLPRASLPAAAATAGEGDAAAGGVVHTPPRPAAGAGAGAGAGARAGAGSTGTLLGARNSSPPRASSLVQLFRSSRPNHEETDLRDPNNLGVGGPGPALEFRGPPRCCKDSTAKVLLYLTGRQKSTLTLTSCLACAGVLGAGLCVTRVALLSACSAMQPGAPVDVEESPPNLDAIALASAFMLTFLGLNEVFFILGFVYVMLQWLEVVRASSRGSPFLDYDLMRKRFLLVSFCFIAVLLLLLVYAIAQPKLKRYSLGTFFTIIALCWVFIAVFTAHVGRSLIEMIDNTTSRVSMAGVMVLNSPRWRRTTSHGSRPGTVEANLLTREAALGFGFGGRAQVL